MLYYYGLIIYFLHNTYSYNQYKEHILPYFVNLKELIFVIKSFKLSIKSLESSLP